MSAFARWNGAYMCTRCLRLTSRHLAAARRGFTSVETTQLLSATDDADQFQASQTRPRRKHGNDSDVSNPSSSSSQSPAKKPRQRGWTTLLSKKSLGQESSVLVLRDSEAKRKTRADVQDQGAALEKEDAGATDILSSMNQDQPEPSRTEVFQNIEAVRPRSQTVPRKTFASCIRLLKNSFSSEQLRSFAQQSSAQKIREPNNTSTGLDTANTALTRVMWKPFDSPTQKQHKTKRITLAEEIMRVTWGIEVEEEAQWTGSVVVKPKRSDLTDMLLAGGSNSLLKELSAKLAMKISFSPTSNKISILGTKAKCLHAVHELDKVLKGVHTLVINRRPFTQNGLSQHQLKAVADRFQCGTRIEKSDMIIHGRDRLATQSFQRLLVSMLPVGFQASKKVIMPESPKQSLLVKTNASRPDSFRHRLREQSLGRLHTIKQLQSAARSTESAPEQENELAVKNAIEFLSAWPSAYRLLLQSLPSQPLPKYPELGYVPADEDSQPSSPPSPAWYMSPLPSLRAEFGHELHSLPQNKMTDVIPRSKYSRLAASSDFEPCLSGYIPLSLDQLDDSRASRQEILRIRLRPSPWMLPKTPCPKGIPAVEIKLSADRQSQSLVVEEIKAILDRRIACVLRPSDEFDMRLISEHSISLHSPGSNPAVKDYLSRMRDLSSQQDRLFPPLTIKLQIPKQAIDFSKLNEKDFNISKDGKELAEVEWFAEGLEFEERLPFEYNGSDGRGEYELNYHRIQGGEVSGSHEGISLTATPLVEIAAHQGEESPDASHGIGRFSKEAFDLLRKLNSGMDHQHSIMTFSIQSRQYLMPMASLYYTNWSRDIVGSLFRLGVCTYTIPGKVSIAGFRRRHPVAYAASAFRSRKTTRSSILAMGSDHRKILPAPLHQARVDGASASPAVHSRRGIVRAACNRCRAKKISCDGNRSSCSTCLQRGDVCIYVTGNKDETPGMAVRRQLAQFQGLLTQHEELIQHLQSAPEAEALATIRRLKATPNLDAVLSSIKGSPAPQRPSDLQTARATLPFTQSGLEFELAVLHGNAYPALPNIDTSAIDVSSIFKRRTNSVHPHASTNALLENYHTLSTKPAAGSPTKSIGSTPPSPLRGTSNRANSPLLGPPPDRVYCDERLRLVRFQYWTRVPVSDEFAASIISVYLENEHAIIGTFDTHTFLDDLVGGRFDFCSSFLVSSLLCLASLCFSSLDLRAFPLAVAFLKEAESLWRAERSSDSVPSLAAMITLGLATMTHGKDEISLELFADGRRMAERMCLIGVPHTHQLSQKFHQLPLNALGAFAHAAWGCYNWLSVHASYYAEQPVAFPPILPIPGLSIGVSGGDWPANPQPDYLGHTFAEWCKLWTISQEIQALYHRRDATPLQDAIPYAFAEAKYHKLLSWANTLSQGMKCKDQSSPHVSVLHANYHIIILDLFRPFLGVTEHIQLKSFASQDSSPKAVFDASLRQLQRILLDYTTTNDPRFHNFTLNGAVLHIVHAILQNRDTLGWRFNLALGMGWMKEIFVRFAAMGKVAQAYLSIGMDSGMISSGEAREFMEDLQRRGRHHNLADVATSCIVDFEVAMMSKRGGRAQDLAQRFDELALFDDFITDYTG